MAPLKQVMSLSVITEKVITNMLVNASIYKRDSMELEKTYFENYNIRNICFSSLYDVSQI